MPTDKEWANTAKVLNEIYKENMDEWGKIAKVEFTDIVIKFANMYEGTSTEFDENEKGKFLYKSANMRLLGTY
jgi:hypothetical protein|tara:strand:- start:890 stop:1108 length:219 start_codon:yes stop_codon:yes gene_type:complete